MTETRTPPIVVHIPDALALTNQQVNALEAKWATDLSQALAASGARISLDITIRIHIGKGK
jgi:hypothetical protein